MEFIISGTNMKRVDKYTMHTVGMPSLVLMERAALSVVDKILSEVTKDKYIAVVCGIGNNGADGIAVARILCTKGFSACVYILGNIENATKEFRHQLDVYWAVGGVIKNTADEKDLNFLLGVDVIVDAMLGVGLSRNVIGRYGAMINLINTASARVYSVDVPSGVNADNGEIMNVAVKADCTITFGMNKTGLVMYPGCDQAGEVVIADIGFPVMAYENVNFYASLQKKDLAILPKRITGSNKGTYGKILVVSGRDGMTGAAYMCALAAFRMGAGMVKVATTNECACVLRTMIPEAMVDVYDRGNYREVIENAVNWCDVIVAGPGMGVGDIQKEIIGQILDSRKLCVIDADGINCLSESDLLKNKLHVDVIMTPHMGEMSRFTGIEIADIKKRPIECAEETAGRYDVTMVLKDAKTIITNGEETMINTSGNNGMSTAGSGDVLAGILGAVLARYNIEVRATEGKHVKRGLFTALGVFIHGMAGDMAAGKKSKTSLMATDIIEEIVNITNRLEDNDSSGV